jgi:predicted transposase YbfD/YdcC
MVAELKAKVAVHFAALEDPRTGPAILHRLIDIVVIALCAVICGADDWEEVELFGQAKYDWLKGFLELPHGIPSHDTFNRVFARLDPAQFEQCFLSWVQAVAEVTKGQVIALDGKTLRRSHDRYLGKEAIHMVSAWASDNQLVLG